VCCRTERASAGRPLANPAGEKRARSVVVAHPLPRACSLRVCRKPRTSTASFSSACHSPAAASAVRYRLSTSRSLAAHGSSIVKGKRARRGRNLGVTKADKNAMGYYQRTGDVLLKVAIRTIPPVSLLPSVPLCDKLPSFRVILR